MEKSMQPNANDNVMGNASQTAPRTVPQAAPANQNVNMMTQGAKPKNNKGMMIGMIVLAILAVGGIGFGVWAFLSGNQKEDKISELNNQVSSLQSQIAEQSDVDETIIEVDTDSVADTAKYIYVGEWGIKIKIPDTLSTVSYRFSNEAGFTKVTVWGVDCSGEKCQYFPDYANVNKNNSGMGSIARYPKGAEFDMGSAPTLVFSDDSYDYYQYHIQLPFSSDNPGDESSWEMEGIKIIDEMLSEPNNYLTI